MLKLKAGILSAFQLYNNETSEQNKFTFNSHGLAQTWFVGMQSYLYNALSFLGPAYSIKIK